MREVSLVKIAFCEDDTYWNKRLRNMAADYAVRHPERSISVSVFSDPEDLLKAAGKIGGFDIYVLDIVMPRMNGIELGMLLRQSGYDGRILYLTSSEEYAIDSFKVKPFNYILKPVSQDTLFAALDEAIESLPMRQEKSLIVKTQENSVKLNYDSILYAELNRRSVAYHLTNGKTVESVSIRTTFAEAMQDLLKDSRFVLCRATMVVNLYHITMIENEALVFRDKQKTYLGKKACRDLRSIWYDFCFNEENAR